MKRQVFRNIYKSCLVAQAYSSRHAEARGHEDGKFEACLGYKVIKVKPGLVVRSYLTINREGLGIQLRGQLLPGKYKALGFNGQNYPKIKVFNRKERKEDQALTGVEGAAMPYDRGQL